MWPLVFIGLAPVALYAARYTEPVIYMRMVFRKSLRKTELKTEDSDDEEEEELPPEQH